MNVASLENSKRLYELSGWHETEKMHWKQPQTLISGNKGIAECPAYDLGYLLRKLPSRIELKERAGRKWAAHYYGGRIEQDYNGKEVTNKRVVDLSTYVRADTPEDALALLAIKLFDEAVL